MFFTRQKSKLGVDIGTSSIKVVQLKKEQSGFFLEHYGVAKNVSARIGQKSGLGAISETADVLKSLLQKSQTTTKKVVASLPNNIVFVTVIEMPAMSGGELKKAIEWEAKRYVPLPLEEVTLSWSVLQEAGGEAKQKVLLTAVPTMVIENYLKMFGLAGLRPQALEIEALALIRSLVGPSKESFIIIDIGARTTTVNLVDQGFLRVSRNLSVGGESIAAGIAQSLNISLGRAEQFKQGLGLSQGLNQEIPQAIKPSVDRIKNETEQLISFYEASGGRMNQIIFAGSGSRLPGLIKYFMPLAPKVTLGDPLRFISYPPAVQQHLTKISFSLSVAIGLAMRE